MRAHGSAATSATFCCWAPLRTVQPCAAARGRAHGTEVQDQRKDGPSRATLQPDQDDGTGRTNVLDAGGEAMNVATFLDQVNASNGPADVHPEAAIGRGATAAPRTNSANARSDPARTLDHDVVAELVARAGGRQGGIVSPSGPAGSMILFHSCWCMRRAATCRRGTASASTSACARSATTSAASSGRIHRDGDFTPIECLPDDCLLREDPVDAAVEGRHAAERAVQHPQT